ncbi:hypothetical protein DM806_23335 [Sphingobium lactosutens]|nr:hypothetical protein [Sphingobium lactosutens]
MRNAAMLRHVRFGAQLEQVARLLRLGKPGVEPVRQTGLARTGYNSQSFHPIVACACLSIGA